MSAVQFAEPDPVAAAHQRLWELQEKEIPKGRAERARHGQALIQAFSDYQKARYEAQLSPAPMTLLRPPSLRS